MAIKLKKVTPGIKSWFILAMLSANMWITMSVIGNGNSRAYMMENILSYVSVLIMLLSCIQLAIRLKPDSHEWSWFCLLEKLKTDTMIDMMCLIAIGAVLLFSWLVDIYYVWTYEYNGSDVILYKIVMFILLLPEAFSGVLAYVILVRRFKDKEKRKDLWIISKLPKRKERVKKEGPVKRCIRYWNEKVTGWKVDYQRGYDFEKKQIIRSYAFIGIQIFIIVGLIMGFSVLIMIFPLAFGIMLYMGQREFYHDVGQILGELHHLSEGQQVQQVYVEETSPLYDAACDLDKINESLDISVQRQMQSEQMKVDLITNVSHDLKTPLTSIIGYIDLLKKEEMSPEAKDYVSVISVKSERLKEMIQDLFEISKATSGNAELVLEKLDMVKLIEQTLGDMEDRIENSGRTIRTNFPEDTLYISGDGKKLYRVYQNLIENALKYSLENTRIYVDVVREDQSVITTVKNIAAYEMNFTTDKIVERFQRGDDSRTTEGHGLGLAIAKSFSEACGGQLDIVIDGDMFKAIITYPVYREI